MESLHVPVPVDAWSHKGERLAQAAARGRRDRSGRSRDTVPRSRLIGRHSTYQWRRQRTFLAKSFINLKTALPVGIDEAMGLAQPYREKLYFPASSEEICGSLIRSNGAEKLGSRSRPTRCRWGVGFFRSQLPFEPVWPAR